MLYLVICRVQLLTRMWYIFLCSIRSSDVVCCYIPVCTIYTTSRNNWQVCRYIPCHTVAAGAVKIPVMLKHVDPAHAGHPAELKLGYRYPGMCGAVRKEMLPARKLPEEYCYMSEGRGEFCYTRRVLSCAIRTAVCWNYGYKNINVCVHGLEVRRVMVHFTWRAGLYVRGLRR